MLDLLYIYWKRASVFILTASLTFLCGCSSNYINYCLEDVEGFVADSYLIREGKAGILELQGCCWDELCCDDLEEYFDSIVEDDILNLAVYHPKRPDLMASINQVNMTIGFHVREGKITIPDLEEIDVAGLSLEEARSEIQRRYRKQIQDIDVFLGYKDRLSRKIELMGLCAGSTIPVDGKLRLFEALSMAGIPTTANLHMSYIIRNGCQLPVDFHALIICGDMCQNIVLRGGDRIYIAPPDAAKVWVMGEVGRPIGVNVIAGYLPIQEALVAAGGIPYTGDRRRIKVIRSSVIDPKIYSLSWEHIVHLPNESLLLMPGDTVYIEERPITSWNRFISQLLMPFISNANVGYQAYRTFSPGV